MRCTGEWSTEEDIIANVAYFPDTLYRNNGDGTFTDVTEYLGEGSTDGAGFAATWFDYNGDNRLDLYLANDFVGVSPDHNRLWRNDGPASGGGWRFTDVSDESGTAFWMNTMGIAVGDVERDGDLDMALSNITANKYVRNDGAVFVEDPAGGIGRPLQQADTESITWGGGFHDLNLDGWEDLYFAAGNFLRGVREVGEQPNELFVNRDGATFLDVSAATGADDPADSKGVAFADYDSDGDLDLFVVNQGGTPRLLRNVTPIADSNHWLQVDTVGTISNRDGCGARVVARRRQRDDATGDVWLDQRRLGQPDDGPLRPRLRPTCWSRSRSSGPRASASGSPTSPSTGSSPLRRLAPDGPRRDAPSVHGTSVRRSLPRCSRCATSPSATDRCRRTTTSRSRCTPGRSMPSSARTARASRRCSASPPAPSSPTPGSSRSTVAS